jgi:hypothetical protein
MAGESFARLGLLPGADTRDIRRAYARALKKIDQATDADGFQRLRADYEDALACGQLQVVQTEQDSVPDAVPAAPAAPAEATPDQLADAVTAAFRTAFTTLVAKHGSGSAIPFEVALRQALADERLFGIEARLAFEMRIAVLLLDGWQPGHEALLVAAATVFDWTSGMQLASLGYAGAMIDQALEERAMFDRQPVVEKQAQRRVLKMLRQGRMPAPGSVMQDLPFFQRMQARFPCWLAIVAPQASLDYWAALVAQPHTLMAAAPGKTSSWTQGVMVFLCLAAIVRLVEHVFSR